MSSSDAAWRAAAELPYDDSEPARERAPVLDPVRVIHETATTPAGLRVTLIRGAKDSYRWEISYSHISPVNCLAEIQSMDLELRRLYGGR